MYSLTEAVTQIPIKKGGFVGASMVFDLGKGGGCFTNRRKQVEYLQGS